MVKTLDLMMQEGNDALRRRRYTEAINVYREADRTYPRTREVRNNLAVALNKAGQQQSSASLLQDLVNEDPCDTRALLNLGATLYDMSQYDGALKYYYQALGVNGTSINILKGIAETLNKLNEFDKSIEMYREIIELKPQYSRARFEIAVMFSLQEKFDEAISEYRSFVKSEAKSADGYYGLSITYLLRAIKNLSISDVCSSTVSIGYALIASPLRLNLYFVVIKILITIVQMPFLIMKNLFVSE